MVSEGICSSLKKAYGKLLQAEAELNRPHEDVVILSACQSVRTSMKQMMRLYLLAHSLDDDDKMSIEEFMSDCIKANKLFSGIDITGIECKGLGHEECEGKYCLSIDNIRSCVTAANGVKSVIWSEFNIK